MKIVSADHAFRTMVHEVVSADHAFRTMVHETVSADHVGVLRVSTPAIAAWATTIVGVMSKPLRVLLVEDSERDAALLRLHLRRGGYDANVQRVDTRAALEAQLREGPWDVVVSDFNLPGFEAFAARTIVQESGGEIPFIVLSGDFSPSVIEGMAAAGIRYAGKYEMGKLVPIIDDRMRERA
jgi:CheY-like chemotaxis protein